MSTGASARAPRLLLALLALTAAAWRLHLAPTTPQTFDEVSFLLALERYDLLAFEPHFPGYPLAVLTALVARALGAAQPYVLVGAVALPAALAAVFCLAGGGWRGLWAAALVAWAPLAAHEGLRPMADGLAASLVIVGAAILLERWDAPASTRRVALGAFVLGAAAAAKPDHALFLSLLVLPCAQAARPARATAAALACVVAWGAFGLAALAHGCGGLGAAWSEGVRFMGGHLGDWGGLDSHSPRVVYALAPLGDLGLSALPARLLGLSALGALALRSPRGLRRAVLVGVLPYAAWLVLGQNLAHPRHALALLPLFVILAARGLGSASKPRALLAGVLLAAACAGTLARSRSWREGQRPLDEVVAWMEALPPAARLYAGGSARPLRYRCPGRDVRRVRDLKAAWLDLDSDPTPPSEVFVTHEVTATPAGLPRPLPPR